MGAEPAEGGDYFVEGGAEGAEVAGFITRSVAVMVGKNLEGEMYIVSRTCPWLCRALFSGAPTWRSCLGRRLLSFLGLGGLLRAGASRWTRHLWIGALGVWCRVSIAETAGLEHDACMAVVEEVEAAVDPEAAFCYWHIFLRVDWPGAGVRDDAADFWVDGGRHCVALQVVVICFIVSKNRNLFAASTLELHVVRGPSPWGRHAQRHSQNSGKPRWPTHQQHISFATTPISTTKSRHHGLRPADSLRTTARDTLTKQPRRTSGQRAGTHMHIYT